MPFIGVCQPSLAPKYTPRKLQMFRCVIKKCLAMSDLTKINDTWNQYIWWKGYSFQRWVSSISPFPFYQPGTRLAPFSWSTWPSQSLLPYWSQKNLWQNLSFSGAKFFLESGLERQCMLPSEQDDSGSRTIEKRTFPNVRQQSLKSRFS